MSEPSCLSELEMDLQSCLHHLEQADVKFTASSLTDLRSSTLELLWDSNWKINCLRERYTTHEMAFPLNGYFEMLFGNKTSNSIEDFRQNLWQNCMLENSSKVYADVAPTQYRFSHTIATWAKFWIEPAKDSPAFQNIRQTIRLHLPFRPLSDQSATTPFTKRMEAFKSIYVDEIDQHCPADLGTDFVKDLFSLKLASSEPRSQPRFVRETVRGYLLFIENTAFRKVHDALGESARIDRWLLQIFQQSITARVLSSQHSKTRTPLSPRISPLGFQDLGTLERGRQQP